uniref:Uncharacterized protein n=1 Tax=Arion vulgaris TaxID=1028688 RepID=A0A0B6ZMG3_9EUPU
MNTVIGLSDTTTQCFFLLVWETRSLKAGDEWKDESSQQLMSVVGRRSQYNPN